MKVAVEAVFKVCNRTELVDVSDEALKVLKAFKGCPYKGKNPKDFVKYIPTLLDFVRKIEDDDEKYEELPRVMQELFAKLGSGDKTVEQAWSGAEHPVPVEVVAFDDNGREINGARADNGEEYF
jgi:hypothetical protein